LRELNRTLNFDDFLSLGFCKICFSLFSGLSSLAVVYSTPENVDILVAAIVLGLLAPVLSFTVASGAGIGALTSISSSGQGLGINTGVSLYYPGTGGNDNSNNRQNRPGENS
jgi:ABC-type transport system involved in cytochrome c biogenesis permease component